jgi:hypothetical protein
MVRGQPTTAIELSALREEELQPLMEALDSLDLQQFSYVSIHAPSKLVALSEQAAVELLGPAIRRGWPIVVHPDVIEDFDLWNELGEILCIENMDKRKRVGRTAQELALYFARLPQARLCFDIGHACQVDPTMCEAETILEAYQDRVRQVHMSLVNTNSGHERMNYGSLVAFKRVAHRIPKGVPIILETPVSGDLLLAEIEKAEMITGGT